MRIVYSPRATRDLEDLREYLAERSPKGTSAVMMAIFAAIEFIRRFPDSAETTRIPGVRGKFVQRHRFKVFFIEFLSQRVS